MKRMDGRTTDQLRAVSMQPGFISTAAGSCLIACGGTRVLCTASVEERQPPFLKGSGMGWITAEYAMLPASTGQRKQRDGIKKDGRGVEIGRLIGRALRKAVDMSCLGPRTITGLREDTIVLSVGGKDTPIVLARWAIRNVEAVTVENEGEILA